MTALAIRVENLSKLYHIGRVQTRHDTLRDALVDSVGRLKALPSRVRSSGPEPTRPDPDSDLWALRDVSFEVRQGEVLGIIGRNGAGKSTLLKILSRITEPTGGCAEIHGRLASLLEVGTGFHPELTGRENIYLNGAILGMRRTEIESKFDEIVAFSEIEKFLDTPVKRYSSGMYVRLAFAVAAHLEPEILLVDEVLAVGDVEFQKRCLGRMRDVAHGGRTVLFVSHSMNAVEDLCSRVMLLRQGTVERLDSDVRKVTSEYLFGANALNYLPMEWSAAGNDYDNQYFRPLRFFLCNRDGARITMPASNSAEMWVQVEGQVELADPALTVGYAIYSETGSLLYWSYQTDQPEAQWPRLARGKCVLRGQVPSRLLNEGVYRVELIGSLHYREWLLKPGVNAPAIYLTIQGGLSDSPYWMIKRPGVLAPVLRWVQVEPCPTVDS